jgi:hypothetical protein
LVEHLSLNIEYYRKPERTPDPEAGHKDDNGVALKRQLEGVNRPSQCLC